MAKHNIYFDLPTRELTKVDAHFYIYKDGKKLGQMTISKGSLEYYPTKSQTPISISWSEFDRLMKEQRG